MRKSLVDNSGGEYILKPVLRLVDNTEVGAIAGSVGLTGYGCDTTGNAVYVYSGHGAALADLNTARAGSPVLIAPVREADGTIPEPHYRAAFLPAGNYTVALTCETDTDTAEGTEGLVFQASYNVAVTADETTTQNFGTP